MITTGLPYTIEQMETINNEGAIVDMSDINFPKINPEDQKRTALIYLRNTNFNVTLDFSKCSYQDRRNFLYMYITSDLDIEYEEFSITWMKILLYSLDYYIEQDSDIKFILEDEETLKFINEEQDIIHELYQLILSLSTYALFKSTLGEEIVEMDIEKTDKNIIGASFYHLLSYPEIEFIFDADKFDIKPLFYEKIFTIKNKNLLNALDNLLCTQLLYGMMSIDPDIWKNMVDSVNTEINELSKEVENNE
jgi:hypothetical protein